MRAKSVFQKVFHFCGSIQLAIALMVILAISMGWATFIEREMGSPVAQALIYASNWFYALIAALALNIFFSALARIPRAFTREPDAAGKAKLRFNSAYFPFFMAHVGILVLLVGCWITARSGLQARMIIPEGTAVDSAIDVDSRLFEIEIADFASDAEPRKLTVPFAGGPLNWADVASKKGWEDNVASPVLSTVFAESRAGEFWADLGKSAAKRGQQAARLAAKVALDVKPRTLFDRDGVRLEILDYQTITEYAPVSPLALTLKTPGASRNVELALPGGPDAEPELDPLAESRRAKRQTLEDGWRVVYLLADSQAEFDAFAALAPEPNPDAGKTNADGTPISKTDCVVLVVDGERFQLGLADLAPLSRSGNPAEQRESLEIQRDEIARRLAAEAEVASDAAPSQTMSRDALLESNARLRELSDKLAAAEPSPTAAQAAELRETRAAFMRERTLNYLATAWAQLESATPTSGEFCETLRKMAEQTAERLAEIEKLEKITVLGKTGWQIVGFEVSPTLVSGVEELQGWTATLQLQSPLGELAEVSLNSELSERNRLPENGRVFGALWLDTPAGEDSAYGRKWNPALTAPKIEIMQSSNGAAACRFIAGVGDVKTLPIDASVFDGKAAVVEFGAPTLSSVSISQMAAQDEFGVRFVPGAFKKDMANEFYGKAKVRLTLDGRAETFWLRSLPLESVSPEQAKYMVKTFSTPTQTVTIRLVDEEIPLGAALFVKRFTPVYEPGSSTAASFSSLTRVLPPDLKPEEQAKIVAETPENDVLIRMNRPGVVKSPQTGRTFWAYQDSFRGPFKPGDAEFDSVCGGKLLPAETTPRERLYYTIISLNSDPGRGLKYLGSLFIVWGTALLIYRKKKRAATPETSESAASTTDNSAMKTPETLVKSVVFVAALLAGTNATLAAEAAPAAPKTAARAEIDWTPWRLLPVFDGGRRQPLNTFAEILVKDVCGVKSPVIAAPEDVLKELEGDKALNFPTLEEMLQDVPEADKARQTELFREAEAAALDQQRAAAAKIRAAFPNGRRKFGSAELLFSWIVEPEIWELLPFIADDDCVVAKEALKRSPLDVAKRFGRLSPSDFELVDAKSGRTLVEQFKTAGRSGNATAALKAISAAEKRVASFRSVAYVPTQTRSSRPRVHLNKALFGEPDVGMNGFHAASPSAISRLSASAQKLERLVAYEDKEVRSSSPFFDKTFLLRERTPIPGADGKDSGRETLKLERELYAAAMVYGSRPLPVAGQIFENLYSRADDALARLRRHRDEIFAAQTFSDEYRQELQVAVGALSETVAAVEAAYLSLVEEEPKILAVAPVVRRRVFHTDESQDSPWVSLQTLLWAPDAMYARFVEPAYAPDVLGLTAAGREFPDFSDRVGPEKSAAEAAEPISPFAPFDAALTQTLEESRYRRDAARAFLAAASAYRDKSAFDGAKVGAALQEFADAVRALAGDSEPFRAALAEEETADEALGAQFLAKTAYPAPGDLGAEYFYYRLNPFYWNWIACLLATLALAASFVRGIWRREERLFFGLGLGFLVASCCVAFWGGAIRAYVTGWAPVTNMYETVVLLAFLIAAIAVGFALYPIWGAPFAAAWRAAGCKSLRRAAVGIPGGVVWTLFAVRAVATVACVVLTARICYAEQVFDGGLVKTIAESFAMQGILDRVAVLGTFLFVAWGVPRFLAATLGLIVFPKALFPPLVGVEFWRVGVSETIRRKTLLTASAVAALLVAASAYFNSSEFNPNIRPLVAVLRSNFWLTIHVFAIIISYALGAIAWMISLTSLADYIFGRYSAPSSAASPSAAPVSRRAAKKARRAEKAPSAPSNSTPRAVREPDYCVRVAPVIAALIRSAVLFLTVGIILGARWADFSWGRFWSWDPKEVWALVTLLIYLVVLHALRLRGGKNFGLSAGATLGALAIVTTWYGLSFVMGGGGRHAYAAGESNKVAVLYVAFALNIGWVALAFIRYAIENFRNRGAAREA